MSWEGQILMFDEYKPSKSKTAAHLARPGWHFDSDVRCYGFWMNIDTL
ncbi:MULTISPECIES: hypothetical protein [unclassified Streptococcus]|nr:MULTISPECIES: hypothetical protein [unclassified Streptococcus]MBF0788260.1 hypothetical protein [Streptococcus sp. 19428wC2_LYSM12]MCQ9211798.1 hypothetical protein [Streptococcus sp. B01]MCQ9212918.1 hypothetical protein [Streptococcus sp. O1]